MVALCLSFSFHHHSELIQSETVNYKRQIQVKMSNGEIMLGVSTGC